MRKEKAMLTKQDEREMEAFEQGLRKMICEEIKAVLREMQQGNMLGKSRLPLNTNSQQMMLM